MKRILKLFVLAAVGALSFFAVSCGEDALAPEGMQVARGGEDEGYYFYVPDGWVVANYGDFASAYVSKANPTAVTFAEAEMPESGKDGFSADEAKAYFADSMKGLAYAEGMKISVNGEEAGFGNAKGFKFDFTYDYPREDGGVIKYRSLQYLIARGERLYVFQYSSRDVAPDYSSDGKTYFDIYLEADENTVNASDVIAQFKFLEKEPVTAPKTAGSSGELVLVSDKDTAGFNFYAPSDSVPVSTGALVQHDLGGGSSVAISELVLSTTAEHPDKYFEGIRVNMEKAFGTVNHLNPATVENENRISVTGANWGYVYEYSYSYGGEDYRGCMIIIGKQDGLLSRSYYAFTYTAKTASYDKALLDAMVAKLEF